MTRIERQRVSSRDLLGLAMIVKNEAHGILTTLETFRPFIDRWTVLDTGSTDGTQEIIQRTLAEIPGELHEAPFVDFSTSRNHALKLHGARTTFVVMPDSDDRLIGGASLREFLAAHRENQAQGHEAYQTHIRRGELSYFLPLVMRTKAAWRYTGRVHECAGRPGSPPATIRIPNVTITQDQAPTSLAASKARWERDLVMLRADAEADPKNSRIAFYLAQTLDCLGHTEEALAEYQRRIDLGGWAEETFEAKLRRGRMLERLDRWPDALVAYLDAHAFDASRAEPLYAIADYYYRRHDNLPMTFLFARRAAEMPKPGATLFVDQDVYDWKAAHLCAIAGYYLDENARRAGASFADHVVRARPGDDLARFNRGFYARSATELFGARARPLGYVPSVPFVSSNPSVHFDGQSWRCLIRTVNYRIVNGYSYVPPDGVICTQNVMAELSPDLDVIRFVPMRDLDRTPRTAYPVHGYEDCRLFRADKRLYCTATVCDFSFERDGAREIVLCEIDQQDDYAITRATPLRGSWSGHEQKNWMPPANVDGRIVQLAYAARPTTMLQLDLEARAIRNSAIEPPISDPHLRGGSQLVPMFGGYLCVVHDVVFSGGVRVYLHRFVHFDRDFRLRAASPMFYFQHRGIEYCCGLGYDPERRLLVASYSVNDASAALAIFDVDRVEASLHEGFVS